MTCPPALDHSADCLSEGGRAAHWLGMLDASVRDGTSSVILRKSQSARSNDAQTRSRSGCMPVSGPHISPNDIFL
eukprot:3776324-Pleurochrysis_carterae.AAC.2